MTGQWKTIETAPTNLRVIVQANSNGVDEIAIGWKDRFDEAWYYAPQGGRLHWPPTHWMDLPDPPGAEIDPTVILKEALALLEENVVPNPAWKRKV